MADDRHITVTVDAALMDRLSVLASGFGCASVDEFARLIIEEVGSENATVSVSASVSAEKYMGPLIWYGLHGGMALMCAPRVPSVWDETMGEE